MTDSNKESPWSRERRLRKKLKDNLEFYAANELTIRVKEGGLARMQFNKTQKHLHQQLEDQRKERGFVRAIVLKGRQQGISTYTAARFYHQTTHRKGCKTFILTHEEKATSGLFDIVARFNRNVSDFVRPSVGIENKSEIFFDKLSSGYQVATAGTAGVGRGSTIQLFHASEVAFWPNAESHIAGVLQAVARLPGTEIVLESTANGMGNMFHRTWTEARAGNSDYRAIFLPWYWQDEYQMEPPLGTVWTAEEKSLKEVYGLTLRQLAWRRLKIAEFGAGSGNGEPLFRQEYPMNEDEAFQSTGGSFIDPAIVLSARARTEEAIGPLIIGVDPAGDSPDADKSAICWRVGRKVLKIEGLKGLDTMALAGRVKAIIDQDEPARVFVDAIGLGRGVYDRLKEWGPPYSRIVRPVNVSEKPFRPQPEHGVGPKSRREEMWMEMRDWLTDEVGVDLPNDDDLQRDLCAPSFSHDSHSRIILESKRDMRKRGANSPDMADALALTFSEPVSGSHWKEAYRKPDPYGRDSYSQKAVTERGVSNWALS